MAIGWDQIFAQAEMRDWVEREIHSPIRPFISVAPRGNWPDETFTFEHDYRDHHEIGEARDFQFIRSEHTVAELAETPMPAEEVMRTIREIQARISRETAMGFFCIPPALHATPDRPPPLAAPSSRLPSYRPRG